ELAGVTLAAVLIGLACVLAGRGETEPSRTIDPRVRLALALALVAISGLTIVALLGNLASGAAGNSFRAGDMAAAERHARQAIRWAPWSAVGWKELGEAQLS